MQSQNNFAIYSTIFKTLFHAFCASLLGPFHTGRGFILNYSVPCGGTGLAFSLGLLEFAQNGKAEDKKYPWHSDFQVLLIGQKSCILNFSNRLALLTTYVHYSIHAIHHQ